MPEFRQARTDELETGAIVLCPGGRLATILSADADTALMLIVGDGEPVIPPRPDGLSIEAWLRSLPGWAAVGRGPRVIAMAAAEIVVKA